jgi:DNA-binding PadR family transcriptional regulator
MAALSVSELNLYSTHRYSTYSTIGTSSMADSNIPSLGYALLGLLQKPSSGYDLRKVFSSTSMKTYSDSPGAIYPALRRLEHRGLVRGTIEEGSGMRRRQVFHLTQKGLSELKKWITRPVGREDLVRGQQEIMLRFAFSETAVGPAAATALAKSLGGAVEAYITQLHEELNASKATMPTSARLAFEGGIRATECLQQWARYVVTTYEQENKGGAL